LLKSLALPPDCPEGVLEGAGALWSYATKKWLTYRTPTGDGTKSRWPIAPEWKQVQQASLVGNTLGFTRVREGASRGSVRKLLPGLTGYLHSYGAERGAKDLTETLGFLRRDVEEYERAKGREFTEELAKRSYQLTT
jgi:hypothetical protein